MPLDPRIILGAVPAPGAAQPFDPIATMGRIAQTQGQVQQQQVTALQLADAQRAEADRGTLARAFQDPRARVTDPATGVTTVDVPKALGLALTTSRNPLGIVKVQQEYGKSQAESRKATLEATKAQLDTTAAQLDISGRIANGIEQSIAAGTDPNAAWTAGLEEMRRNGIPTPSAPPTYDKGFLEQWKGKALTQKDALAARQKVIDQELEKDRIAISRQQESRLSKGQASEEAHKERTYQLDLKRFGITETEEKRKQQAAAGEVFPYTSDSTLNTELDALRQQRGLPRGAELPADLKQQALKNIEEGKTTQAERTGYAGAVSKPLEGPALQRVNMLMQGEDVVKALQTEFTPEERAQYVGLGGLRMTVQQAQQLLQDAQGGKGDPKFARFAALVALGKQEAFSTGGQALSAQEREIVFGYIPTGREWSAQEFEQKLKLSGERVPTLIDRELTLSTTPRSELREKRRKGELPSMSPGSPAAAPTTTQPLVPATEAMIADAMQQLQKPRAEVLELFRKKGTYQVPAQ